MKTCNICSEEKPYGDFYTAKNNKDGFSCKCKECSKRLVREYKQTRGKGIHRKSMLMLTYGITVEYYNKLLEEQGNACAICGSTSSNIKSTDNFLIDHNHKTGEVRGLLCNYCNLTLGNAKENITRLQKCAEYLIERGDYNSDEVVLE
jgi:hypothetical protein